MKNVMYISAMLGMLIFGASATAQTRPIGDPEHFARAVDCATAVHVHRTPPGGDGVAVGDIPLTEAAYYAARQRVDADESRPGACRDVDDHALWSIMCHNGWMVGHLCDAPRVVPPLPPPPPAAQEVRIVYRYRERTNNSLRHHHGCRESMPCRPLSSPTPPAQPPAAVPQLPAPPVAAPPPVPNARPAHADVTPSGRPVRPPPQGGNANSHR